MKYPLLFLLISLLLASGVSDACTTFCFSDGERVVFGRNYDWDIGMGDVLVNKRNMSKTAMLRVGEKPAKWISKYGSVTFNQYGREFPMGGANEAGLVVELMMLTESEYPPKDGRPVVGPLEWIQYQLDNSAGIADVLQNSRRVRISSNVKLHYLVCERSGACVTAEFLNGKFAPHSGASLPIAVLTNNTYDASLQYLASLAGFGGTTPASAGDGSLERFGRAATMIRSFQPGTNPVNYSFQILDNVAQGSYTKWSIVYDLTNLRIYFKTTASAQIKYLDLAKLDFSCATPVRFVNIHATPGGDVFPRLHNYTLTINRNLIRQAYAGTPFLANVPDSDIEIAARHPDSFQCLSSQ